MTTTTTHPPRDRGTVPRRARRHGPVATELLELRYRLDDGQRMGQLFERPTRLRGWPRARSRSAGAPTSTSAARRGRAGTAAATPSRARSCCGRTATARTPSPRSREFEPAPSIVIASGTGGNCHAYWPLSEPLARDELERANRRLAQALGADPASADAARILRVPGTVRTSTAADGGRGDPARPRAARARGGRDRRAARPAGAATRAAIVPVEPRGDDPLLAIAPEVYVRRLLGVEVPRHRKVPCPFHEDRHASLHVYETAQRGWYCFGAAAAAARSTTSPPRCTATAPVARTSCGCAPSCAACSASTG